MNIKEKANLAFTGENLAKQYIVKLGYGIISHNYHSPYGELDLVALDRDELVIVEVKTRAKHDLKYAENSISKSKQRKITLTTMHYIANNPQYSKLKCRFDVIIVFYYKRDDTFQIKHIRDAFLPVHNELIV